MKLICVLSFIFFYGSGAFCQTSSEMADDEQNKQTGKGVKLKTLYGTASYYADKFEGRETATGDTYSHTELTAACNVLPLGTFIRVTNLRNNKTIVVRINDRLHPKNKRIVDLSRLAATRIGYISRGLTQVKVEVLGTKKQKQSTF